MSHSKAHKSKPSAQNPGLRVVSFISQSTVFVAIIVAVMSAYSFKALVAFVLFIFSAIAHPSRYGELPHLLDATVDELAQGLSIDLFSSVDLVNAYKKRILEVNTTLHMVTELNPDALKIAKQLDKERAAGKSRGPLHGLPILIKNNIATKDSMNNTAGSYALLGAKVPRDATVAAKLREAGAIILGKTNLSQWANYRSSNASNGWSAHGGQTYGAYYPGQDPSGSSSGSGVASSLGLAVASLGTETSGSIISPSQQNNLVGIKPTLGLTSRSLVIPISERQDTVGPMARTVKDAAYLLQVTAGPDQFDNYTSEIPFTGSLPDYVAACKSDSLKGKRIGVPRNSISLGAATAPVLSAFESALKILREAGAIIIENTNYTAYEEYLNSESQDIVLGADFVANLESYLSQLSLNPNSIHTLLDVRNFTQLYPPEQYPSRDTAVWDTALNLNVTNTSPSFWAAFQQNLYLGGRGGILGALTNYSLDAIVTPSYASPGISALVGAPIITVPLGAYPTNTTVRTNARGDLNATAPGIPFGISFSGALWSEESLIGMAYAFEQRTNIRKKVKPWIQPKTELWDVLRSV